MIDFVLNNLWILWTSAAVLFLITEALTTSLVSIWFVPAAVITALLSLVWDNFIVQLVVFLVLSVVFLILCKKYYKPKDTAKLPEANQQLLGKTARAVSDIDSVDGKVLVGDVHWRAVCDNEISKDSIVEITEVNGTILTVKSKS